MPKACLRLTRAHGDPPTPNPVRRCRRCGGGGLVLTRTITIKDEQRERSYWSWLPEARAEPKRRTATATRPLDHAHPTIQASPTLQRVRHRGRRRARRRGRLPATIWVVEVEYQAIATLAGNIDHKPGDVFGHREPTEVYLERVAGGWPGTRPPRWTLSTSAATRHRRMVDTTRRSLGPTPDSRPRGLAGWKGVFGHD